MARIKNVESYCSFCGLVTKMEVSADFPGSETKKWVRCKKCKQKMVIELTAELLAPKTLDGIQDGEFEVYSPSKSFQVGQSIYHQSWDDYGRVTSKVLLADGKSSITVEFQKVGSKKLIESLTL